MCVGEKIKVYLEEEHLTQAWLSFRTGIKSPKLNLSLSGKRRMTFPEYEVICWALHVGVDKFIEPRKPSKPANKK